MNCEYGECCGGVCGNCKFLNTLKECIEDHKELFEKLAELEKVENDKKDEEIK